MSNVQRTLRMFASARRPRCFSSATTHVRIPHGFTLIELLVVIAIISLLVSILLPSLMKARDLAKTTICASNLRNVVLGFAYYHSEYNGYYPPPIQGSRIPWDVRIQGYLSCELPSKYLSGDAPYTYPKDPARDILACPADEVARDWGRMRSYSQAVYRNNSDSIYFSGYAFKPDDISDPSRLIFLTEWHSVANVRLCAWPGAIMSVWAYLNGWSSYAGTTIPQLGFHGEAANFVFMDNRIELLSKEAVTAENNALWNPEK